MLDPRNARTHPKRQVEQIVASIRAFGFTNPVLADEQGRLIAGHGRLLTAKDLGLAAVPVITLDGLGEAEKKALWIAGPTRPAARPPWPSGRLLRAEAPALKDQTASCEDEFAKD